MVSISIRQAIPLLIITPLVATLGLAGWIVYQGGQKGVDELATKLMSEAGERVETRVLAHMDEPQITNRTNVLTKKSQILKLDDFSSLERYFWNEVQNSQPLAYQGYGNQQGDFLSVVRQADGKIVVNIRDRSTDNKRNTYNLDNQGKRQELVASVDSDTRTRPWYKAAVEVGKATWSPIYLNVVGQIQTAAVTPVYDSNKTLQGVLAYFLPLTEIDRFLHTVKVSPAGQMFIIEPTGEVVANSTDQPSVVKVGNQQVRLAAVDSQEPLIQATARHLQERFGSLKNVSSNQSFFFSFKGSRQIVHIRHIRDEYGLDWLLVVVAPMSDFVENLYKAIRFSVLVGLAVAGLSVVGGLIFARWIIQPLQQLIRSAKAIETNEFHSDSLQTVRLRSDEIGQLARVFDQMASVVFSREQSFQMQMTQMQQETKDAKKSALARRGTEQERIHRLLKQSRQVRAQLPFNQTLQAAATLLRSVVYFQALSDTEFTELLHVGYERAISKGEIICQEGDPGDAFYIILAGSFEVCAGQPPKYIRDRCEGDFFGELALLLGIPRTATVKALEDSLLFVVDHDGLRALLQKNPQIAESIAHRIDEHNVDLEQRKEALQKAGLLEDGATLRQSWLLWIQQRMRSLINIQFKQPV